MYLLETSFLIDLAREKQQGAGPASKLLGSAPAPAGLYVSTITLAQIAVGEHLAQSQRARKRAADFREWLSATCEILSFNLSHAVEFGRIAAEMRRSGRLIPESDIQIAASAVAEGLTLVTRNHKHFSRVTGLTIEIY